jgi:carboxymethylenebutenolidase
MCYDDNARPPMPPGQAGKASGEQIVLRASDGNEFYAYLAVPENKTDLGVLIYPDVRGLHQFYRDLALRFAEMGITAIAMDYFGRTAGLTGREESFEFMPHVGQLKVETVTLDAQAALAHLRGATGANAVFVVGFCMGGSLTLHSGANAELGLAGLIPFYAGMSRDFNGAGTALDVAPRIMYPVLGFFGGADQGIPAEQVAELDKRLDQAGVDHLLITYPNATHSFFDRRAAEFAEASADAWVRLLEFIRMRGKIPQTA